MATEWFVEQQDGSIAGPFAERTIAEDLLAGKIPDELRVRQGRSGAWCSANRARDLFQRLATKGWYIRSPGEGLSASNETPASEEHGPFISEKIGQLMSAGVLDNKALLRQGLDGEWLTIENARSLLGIAASPLSGGQDGSPENESPLNSSTASPDAAQAKWVTEPIAHQRFALEDMQEAVSQCQPFERLLLSEASHPSLIEITRSDGSAVGRLSKQASLRIQSNINRGYTHVCLFEPGTTANRYAIVVECPPGTTPVACRDYINQQFAG